MISHRKFSQITLDKRTVLHEINNSQQPAEKCEKDFNSWNCLSIAKWKLLIIDKIHNNPATRGSCFHLVPDTKVYFFLCSKGCTEQDNNGWMLLFTLDLGLISTVCLAAVGGMLTALKSYCKWGFWSRDLITSEVSMTSSAHWKGQMPFL